MEIRGLFVLPPQVENAFSPAQPPDWNLLFVEAGLDPAKGLATTPQWTPPIYADERMAWQGSLPERPSVPVRIEGAAYRGKPVYFQFVDPRLDYTWPHEIVRAYAWNSEANSSAFPQERHRLPSAQI